jgi:hypothetical protein
MPGLPLPVVPTVIIAAMIATVMVWNAFVGLSLTPALYAVFAPAALLSVVAGWIRLRRGEARLFEAALYLALWSIWPPVCVWLAYLSVTVGYQLQDNALAAADAALGFHWIYLAQFIEGVPGLSSVLHFVYLSPLWQFAVSAVVLARLAPGGRNGELLTHMLLAMTLSLVIGTFVPAIGPAAAYGFGPEPEAIIHALRSGSSLTLPYAGIVSFPSFHTVMAVLFTYAHRYIDRTFYYVLALNILMLVATLYNGDHYLLDMFAGFLVACGTILVTAVATRRVQATRRPVLAAAREPSSAAI